MTSNPQPAVPFNDLRRSARDPTLLTIASAVIESGWFIRGPRVGEFERAFGAWLGIDHVIGVANGTDALGLAMAACGVTVGTPVLMAANAGGYSSVAARALGADPVHVDVDAATRTIDPALVERALDRALDRRGAAAVIATHLYGQPAAIETLAALCQARKVTLIEDCAQAHGASIGTRKVGTFGAASAFSFYPTKNLGALGDGGAVATADAAVAARVRALSQYGWQAKYRVETDGGRNSRLDELQAALLTYKLGALDNDNARRVAIARAYSSRIHNPRIAVPAIGDGHVAHLYVIECDARDALLGFLKDRGIATDIHYPIPDHLQPAWRAAIPPSLPVSETLAAHALSLPCFPELDRAEIDHVIDTCNAFAG